MASGDPRLLLLGPEDNVLVLKRNLAAGEKIEIDGVARACRQDLPLGHKVARRAIAAGEPVVKYGAPIGVATADIPAGEHVHVHNVRSNYTPTYVLPEETRP